jgi:hypothetical protein
LVIDLARDDHTRTMPTIEQPGTTSSKITTFAPGLAPEEDLFARNKGNGIPTMIASQSPTESVAAIKTL